MNRIALVLAAALALPASAGAAYTATPGPARASAVFTATYSGSGATHTSYRSTPPNAGGHADDNHVKDSSSERWALAFRHPLTVPTCGAAGGSAADPCAALAGVAGAHGHASAIGHVHHVHVDGLYRNEDSAISCSVHARTGADHSQPVAITLRYDAAAAAIDVSVGNPIALTLTALPGSCPKQGDSLDLILDNYFTPGFSFDPGYGPDRWFTSQTVAIPVGVWHRSASIRIPLHPTAAGTPPRNCAVKHHYEHCTTTGSWSGVLTLKAAGS